MNIFESAKEIFSEYGVDVEKALSILKDVRTKV